MAAEHAQAAKEILAAVGGPENVVSAAHCATRLRLVIADDSKVDMDAVEDCSLAKGNFQAAGQLQVIYGTGTVNKVFDEFCAQGNIKVGSTDEAKAAAAAKGNPIQRATKALGDVFVHSRHRGLRPSHGPHRGHRQRHGQQPSDEQLVDPHPQLL